MRKFSVTSVNRFGGVYRQEKKKRLYHLPHSQNNCIEKPALIVNLVNCIEVQLGDLKPSWDPEFVVSAVPRGAGVGVVSGGGGG